MTKTAWLRLRDELSIEPGADEMRPISPAKLDAFEGKQGLRLPRSYRTFCEVFGAGQIGNLFSIAVPGYRGKAKTFDLEHLNRMAHDGQEYDVYSKDPAQHTRGLFFCVDLVNAFHFFDPEEVTGSRHHEYAVWTVSRDYELKRTFDNFWEFITTGCLGAKRSRLIKGVRTEHRFRAIRI
jgi:hypothetical protein